MTIFARSRWLGIALGLATASCAEGSADFHARYEPGFAAGPRTISVFGVFHEGRMSPEAWTQLGPRLSAVLGQKSCEVGYGYQLANADPALYAAVDESVRDEGITEELLERFAAKAEGEMILVLSFNGHTTIGGGIDDGSGNRPTASAPLPGGGRSPRGRGYKGPAGRGARMSALGPSGTLFSVRRRRSVARLNMVYSGSNLDDAIGKFVARLGEVIPGSTCRGWRWEGAEAR